MANKRRRQETIDAEKRWMAEVALQMISEGGLQAVSMRKLAKELKVSTSTIYNYFIDRDELYLYILTRGFECLYQEYLQAYNSQKDPIEKLRAMNRTWVDFGFREPYYVHLMFISNAPKYNDYVGTEHESAAKTELDTALQLREIILKVLTEISETYPAFRKEEIPHSLVSIVNQLVGMVTMYNNNLIDYITDEIKKEIDRLLDDCIRPFDALKGRVQKS